MILIFQIKQKILEKKNNDNSINSIDNSYILPLMKRIKENNKNENIVK